MASRVNRPQKHDEMLDSIVTGRRTGDSKDSGVFATLKDALVFAACLGHKRKKRVPFSKKSEPIDLSVFSGPFNVTAINSLAVAEEEKPDIMGEEQERERLRIFEEYACGGLDILQNEIWDADGDWETGLLTLILAEESEETILRDITGLADY